MRKISWIIGMLILALGYWNCDSLFGDEDLKPVPSALVTLEINSAALADNFIGDPAVRKVTVYVPYDYRNKSDQKAFPVAYLLHGIPFGEKAFIDPQGWQAQLGKPFTEGPDFPAEGFKAWIDELIASGEIEEMIIVMPDATTKYGFSFYTNSDVLGNYEDYIAEDLVNFIDAKYNTIASPEGRAILGISQGGYGAIKMALTRPGIFGTVGCHSAPLWFHMAKFSFPAIVAENPNGMQGPHPDKFLTSATYAMAAAWSPNPQNPPYFADLPFVYPTGVTVESVWARWLEHDPMTLLQQHQNNLRLLNGLQIDCGSQDEFGFQMMTQTYVMNLNQLGIDFQYDIYDGAHFSHVYDRIRTTLRLFSDHLRNDNVTE